MSTIIKRNGHKLCAMCRDKGCERYWGTDDDGPPNKVEPYVSDEPCECCELDVEVEGDDFGI